jgi:hypothetical protein
VSTTPPQNFNPLRASRAQLAEYDFPEPPSSQSAYRAWHAAMAAYKSDTAPTGQLTYVPKGTGAPHTQYATTQYSNWAGYIVGDQSAQSNTYVAVTADFTVPTNSGTCETSDNTAFWLGLGGTNGGADNLVQQGIACRVDRGSAPRYGRRLRQRQLHERPGGTRL